MLELRISIPKNITHGASEIVGSRVGEIVGVGLGEVDGVGVGVLVEFETDVGVGVGVGVLVGAGVGVGVFLGGGTMIAGISKDDVLEGVGDRVILGIFELELFACPTPTTIMITRTITRVVIINPTA